MLIPALLSALAAVAPAPASAAACHRFGADFAPSSGNPQTLRVRFSVWRFGTDRPVYLHYVGPNRHLKRTVRLGTARGRCGFLRTGYRRLFPFTAAPGTWRLVFTTRAAYRVRPAAPFVRLAVSVLRR